MNKDLANAIEKAMGENAKAMLAGGDKQDYAAVSIFLHCAMGIITRGENKAEEEMAIAELAEGILHGGAMLRKQSRERLGFPPEDVCNEIEIS